MTTLRRLQILLEDNPRPMTIRGNTLILRDEEAKAPFYQTLAGAHVCDKETGERLFTHEYDHKSFQNLVYAISQRQFSCMVEPTQGHLDRFEEMVNRWMDSWIGKFKEEWTPNCAFEYIDG